MIKMYFPQYARGRDGIDIILGESILEHIRRLGGVEIDSECGGKGICGKDVIRVEQGFRSLEDLTDVEKKIIPEDKRKFGQRLACQAMVMKDTENIIIFIPDFGKYTILTDTIETNVELQPSVFQKHDRVIYRSGEDLGSYSGKIYGLAVDVGTTTLVMQLVDLESGKNIGKPMASKNPQIAYGNDVISRIGYTINHTDGLKELQETVINGVNNSLTELEKTLESEKGSIKSNIYDIVVVGNSTMRSLFFGQNVSELGVIPFEPSSKEALTRKAAILCLNVHSEALVYGPPLIGGHAGADCLADIIATRLYQNKEISMIIDIGTNGEVVIGNKNRIMTASCAAGGAYEGYQIRCGVGAIEGAITQVKIDNGQLKYKTLGDKHPLGVCGSGVIDLLAELFKNNIMNERARIKENYHLINTVSISQDDINQLIIAKAGLRIDQDLLIRYYGTDLNKISKIYLAGAFGNYMNIDNAVTIGLLPDTNRDKFVRFGNGALAGARDMLLSQDRRKDAERIAIMAEHTKPNEIEGSDFQYMVAERMYFNKSRYEEKKQKSY